MLWASPAERPGVGRAQGMAWWLTRIHTDPANFGGSQQPLGPSLLQLPARRLPLPDPGDHLWLILALSSPCLCNKCGFLQLLDDSLWDILYLFFLNCHSASSFRFPNQLGYSMLLSHLVAAMLEVRLAASLPSLPQPHSGPGCPVTAPAQDVLTATGCQEHGHCHRRGPSVSSGQRLPCSPLPGYLRKVLRNHTAHTCDGEQLLIVCPRKTTISILGAFYGRRVPSPNLCPSPGNASQESTECMSTTAHLVRARGPEGPGCTPLLPRVTGLPAGAGGLQAAQPPCARREAAAIGTTIHPWGPFPGVFLGDKGGRDLPQWVPWWGRPARGAWQEALLCPKLAFGAIPQDAAGLEKALAAGAGSRERGGAAARVPSSGSGTGAHGGPCAQPCGCTPWD